jgi:hypothetical protein
MIFKDDIQYQNKQKLFNQNSKAVSHLCFVSDKVFLVIEYKRIQKYITDKATLLGKFLSTVEFSVYMCDKE